MPLTVIAETGGSFQKTEHGTLPYFGMSAKHPHSGGLESAWFASRRGLGYDARLQSRCEENRLKLNRSQSNSSAPSSGNGAHEDLPLRGIETILAFLSKTGSIHIC
jgi:hypothetical protein